MERKVVAGDVFEVPLGNGWLGYVVEIQYGNTAILDVVAESRPSLEFIVQNPVSSFFSANCTEDEIWPFIGHDTGFEEAVAPRHQFLGYVCEGGTERRATAADAELPYLKPFGEADVVRKICRHHNLPVVKQFLPKPSEDSICNAMSIEFNDVAEQVQQVFDEQRSNGTTAKKALRETEAYFRDDIKGDSDWEVPFWLCLAYLGLEYECLTERVRKKALKILDDESVYDVAWNWPEENKGQIHAYNERTFVVRQFRRRLQSLARWW